MGLGGYVCKCMGMCECLERLRKNIFHCIEHKFLPFANG